MQVRFADQEIAYFSMEIALEEGVPTYSGGLGVLAGDTLRSAADLRLKMIGVTLLYRDGFFKQKLGADGSQTEEPVRWDPATKLQRLEPEVSVELEGRTVRIAAWLYELRGVMGKVNPVIFLDTDLPGNSPEDRYITHSLYSGDRRHRLMQEAVLGIGGVRMLGALGCPITTYHMNEGHSALLALELWHTMRLDAPDPVPLVRQRCVFTTHTPVPAGHDVFESNLALSVLGALAPVEAEHLIFSKNGLDMTELALKASGFVNAVARKHGEVSRAMFPEYKIDSITNGVHSRFWTSPEMKQLFDRHIPSWDKDPYLLRSAIGIPREDLWAAHQAAKKRLVDYLNKSCNAHMDVDTLTIGFARRATPYKRANLVFSDTERLKRIAKGCKGLQIVMGGKAHPNDVAGKEIIREVFSHIRTVQPEVHVVYVEDYDLKLGQLLTSGVDVWLNTPERPNEASGTSGMKAAHNGVPHFSILDGWWLEGHSEGVTGWSIGKKKGSSADDAEDLYRKLETVVIPLYYSKREQWIDMMRDTIAINASFFNTHRMLQQYVLNAYFKHQDDTVPDATQENLPE